MDFRDVDARTVAERKREEEKRKHLDRIHRESAERAQREMEGEVLGLALETVPVAPCAHPQLFFGLASGHTGRQVCKTEWFRVGLSLHRLPVAHVSPGDLVFLELLGLRLSEQRGWT